MRRLNRVGIAWSFWNQPSKSCFNRRVPLSLLLLEEVPQWVVLVLLVLVVVICLLLMVLLH